MRFYPLAPLVLAAACAARDHNGEAAPAAPPAPSAETAPAATGSAHTTAAVAPLGHAELGRPAPDFTLPDTDGHAVHLADFKGKTVVLEWFNPGCPFVRAAHTKGSLRDAAKRRTAEGVVWLAVNSAAAGKQGSGVAATREGMTRFDLHHPVLLDESGDVGHAYGATNTPDLFVIDPAGTLVYGGAVDNSPDGEGASAPGDHLVSYVDAALADLAAGRPVATPSTKPYGCSVKYAHP
jgi:peroxiredoxin